MATHDYVLDNATGANFRSDLNNALAAIVSNNSSSSEPSTKYAYQWWADTTDGVLKIRNSANDGWVTLLQLDGTLTLEDGTNSAPALGFRDDLNTGIFSSAADTLDITCGGTTRGSFSSSGLTVTGNVTATTFVGALTGAATRITNTNEASDTTCFPVFTTSATGDLLPRTNANLNFNASNGTLSATSLSGTLTTAAQTNITSLGNLTGLTLSGDMTFTGDSANIVFDKSDSSLEFADTARAKFGSAADCHIHHNGTDTFISNDTGDLVLNNIGGNSDDIFIRSADNIELQVQSSESAIDCIGNGAVQLYYDNDKKAETFSSGFKVLNQLSIGESVINLEKSGVHHHRIVGNDTGNDLGFQQSSDTGSNTNFTTYLRIKDGGDIALPNDDQDLEIGASGDLRLFHAGNNNEIRSNGAVDIFIRPKDTDVGGAFRFDGAAELYHDGSKKIETTSSGINVTGAITVNGSALSTGGGKVLQVLSANKPDQFSSTSTTFVDVASLTVDITAASSSNKMLVTVHVFANCEDAAILRLMFDSTPVGNGQSGSDANQQGFAMVRQDDGNLGSGYGIQILHTPGDTSQHTYKIQARTTTSSHSININRRADSGFYSLSSSITVEEISA